MEEIEYQLIRSHRKTFSMELLDTGLVVRAPLYASTQQIHDFVHKNRNWIKKHQTRIEEEKKQATSVSLLSRDEIHDLAEKAIKYIPERVKFYAPIIGVTYGKITIRNQTTRWGSCSSKGNLNFNCLLMLAPLEVIDSVVVHELCHRKEMNHSKQFYNQVLQVFPNYWSCHNWLKENGKLLILRMKR